MCRRLYSCVLMLASLLCGLSSLHGESFRNPTLIPTSGDPRGLAAADLNGDGKLDLVYTTGSPYPGQTLHVLLGRGDGSFAQGAIITLPQFACGCFINLADVTGDGILDVILSSDSTPQVLITVLPGKGDGSFGAAIVSTHAVNGSYPALGSRMGIGDLNGDGMADLLVADPSNAAIYVMLGDGAGKFAYASRIADFSYAATLFLYDLDGDGRLDLVLAANDYTTDTLVYLGKGNGSFADPITYHLGLGLTNVILTDLNGDGRPDLVASHQDGTIAILPGNADGTFGAIVTLNQTVPGGTIVEAANYTGVAAPDLLLLGPVGVTVLPAAASLTYHSPVGSVAGAGSPYNSTVGGDWNSDGHRDVAMAVEGGIALLFGKGDGSFASADFYDMGQPVGATAIADFSGDHHADIAVTLPATQPRLLLGDGSGLFTLGPDPNPSYGAYRGSDTATTADFDGDGHPDFESLLLRPAGSVGFNVFFGTSSGILAAPVVVNNGSANVLDINGDGRADMVLIDGADITVQLGQANQTFVQVTTPMRNPEFAAFRAAGDLNGDGKPDLVLSNVNAVEVWLGNGDGTFTYGSALPITPESPIGYQNAVPGAIADIDGDGKADLVLVSSSTGANIIAICWGRGDGAFDTPVMLTPSHVYGQVKLADVDGDGRPDLILSDGIGIAVIESLPNRNFAQEDDYVAGSSIGAFSLADLNGDGYPDLVAADNTGTTVAVLLNQPNGMPPGGAHLAATLAVAPEPSPFGESATVTLRLSSQGGATAPLGSVTFQVDGAFAATTNLSGGAASLSLTATLPSGQHAIVATYNGDTHYAGASYAVEHTVSAVIYSSTTALVVTPLTALTSQTVRLQATVASTGPETYGTVTFYDGAQSIGSAALDAMDKALLDTALLAAGAHTLTAVYDGNTLGAVAVYQPSTSPAVTVTITAQPTTTTLSASTSAPIAATVVTLQAQVSSAAGTPFGGVSFYDGSTLLGVGALVAGDGSTASSSYSLASLAAGQHTLSATFNSNASFAASTGSTPVNVLPAAAQLTPTLTRLSAVRSLTASVTTGTGGSLPGDLAVRGSVTFLDGGRVLGVAPVGEDGLASLPQMADSPGAHTLLASYGGGSAAAPSLSPALASQISSTGSSVALSAAAHTLFLGPGQAAEVSLQAAGPVGATLMLSCINAQALGVKCSFSPSALMGSGASMLTVRSASASGLSRAAPVGLPGKPLAAVECVLAIACLLVPRRRRSALALGFVVLAGMTVGCGSDLPVRPATRSASVLVLQVYSGGVAADAASTASAALVDSEQIVLVQP